LVLGKKSLTGVGFPVTADNLKIKIGIQNFLVRDK
jgi:hypothetical protein